MGVLFTVTRFLFTLGSLQLANSWKTLPEEDMDTVGLITYLGYPAESHRVVTDDGYILTVHRIPHGKADIPSSGDGPRPAFFLQHGLLDSSSTWVSNLANESLGFMLADAGFDVWLGNFRGNTYSTAHTTLDVKKHPFWEFDWDQMAANDLPAMINYALNATGQTNLFYAGHSEGTMTAFAEFSNHSTEYAKKVKHFYALAPVARTYHIKGLLRILGEDEDLWKFVFKIIGDNQFMPGSELTKLLAKYVCPIKVINPLCDDVLFLIAGPNSSQLNSTRLPVYLSHTPAGTSTQNILHFSQGVDEDSFSDYDYGKRINKERYGESTPPTYNPAAMKVPVSLFWSAIDWLADPKDVAWLRTTLTSIAQDIPLTDFNHLDFVWGMRAGTEVYAKVIENALAQV